MRSLIIDVHDNGIVVTESGLLGSSMVFSNEKKEEALLEIYRKCFDYEFNDKVKIIPANPAGDN